MNKIESFIKALQKNGDGRYHYYRDSDGTGIGCSDYVKLCLKEAEIITADETLWAGQGQIGVLADTKRFTRLAPSSAKQNGDILWYHGAHVSVYYNGGVFEAAPESTHPLSDNKKTGVGFYSSHNYNCAGINLTCIYRIKDTKEDKIKASTLVERAINCALGEYGATTYLNYYPANVGQWNGSRWSFDCLGFVHTFVNGFCNNKNVLGGGAVMDDFVLNCTEDATLKSCTTYSRWTGTEPKKGALVQYSGHVGIYIGEYSVKRKNGTIDIYNVAECTPIWGNGVQLSWVDIKNGYRYNKKGGEYRSTWNYFGELGRVDYSEEEVKPIVPNEPEPSKVKLSAKEKLQIAIKIIDGEFGNNPRRKETLTTSYGNDVAIQIQELVNKAFE